MSQEHFYPVIADKQRDFVLIGRLYEANPGYFSDPKCPYPQDIKDIFQKKAKYHDFDSHDKNKVPETDTLMAQINTLNSELKSYGQSINEDETTSASDRNTYFRLSVTLLEKLIDMKERIAKIAEVEIFITAVLDVMDKELSPDQRAAIMSRLESLVKMPETTGTDKGLQDDKDNSDDS